MTEPELDAKKRAQVKVVLMAAWELLHAPDRAAAEVKADELVELVEGMGRLT